MLEKRVKTGAKDSATEQVGDNLIHWVFVEATSGDDFEKRKGFVDDSFLVPEATDVPVVIAFDPFPAQVNREDFATTCYLQAALNGTNPAYLYALAFALSGSQWSPTDVETNDPDNAKVLGVYRFPNDYVEEPELYARRDRHSRSSNSTLRMFNASWRQSLRRGQQICSQPQSRIGD